MTTKKKPTDAPKQQTPAVVKARQKRQVHAEGHKRKFLVVVDETPECESALAFAASRTSRTAGQLALLYVIESGEIEILREKADGAEEHVTVINAGGYFGELGPMLNLPRSASARAVRPTVLTGYSVQQFRAGRRGTKA